MTGMIIRRGGGGTASLHVIAVSGKDALPETAGSDTIAVVTDTEINEVYAQPMTPENAKTGDIWISRDEAAYSVNLTRTGSVIVEIGSIRQFDGTEWIARTAYIYEDTWINTWDQVFYELGRITTRIPLIEKKTPSTCTISYLEQAIECVTKAGSVSEVYAVFGPVDLTEMTKITATGVFPKTRGGTTYAVLFAAQAEDASYADAEVIKRFTIVDSTAGDPFSIELDVSSLDGEYYVYAGTDTNGGDWVNARYVDIKTLKGE